MEGFYINTIAPPMSCEYLTTNLQEHDFWNERDPEGLECKTRSNLGSQEIGGHAHPTWVCPLSPGPLERPPTYFFLLYIPTYPKNIQGANEKQFPLP